jgi:hypothetical protein
VGVAVAYVSRAGFEFAKELFHEFGVGEVRLVADTRDCVTHPLALRAALAADWGVRVVNNPAGTFHPKMYVGGAEFAPDGGMQAATMALVGSGNLSLGGLKRNTECSILHSGKQFASLASVAWKECWDFGTPLSEAIVSDYERRFALRNKWRSLEDLAALGVADANIPSVANASKKGGASAPPVVGQTVPPATATVAWAGLQTLTGGTLQIEFPSKAAEVLNKIIDPTAEGAGGMMVCDDGIERNFKPKFYEDNGMFRLNVPAETPDALWAVENKQGIAVVGLDDHDHRVHFSVYRPGARADAIVRRSLALGTWGRTTTRLYGWY